MRIFLQRSIAIAKKELFHISRDPFTVVTALGLPLFMLFVFGMAIEFNVKQIPLSIYQAHSTPPSRTLISTFSSSGYFIPFWANSPADTYNRLASQEARAGLIIPPDFDQKLAKGQATVQLLIDGSDGSTVAPIMRYVRLLQQKTNSNLGIPSPTQPYRIQTQFLYNPELNSRWFVIPGLTVIILSILSVLLTALTVAQEYENGSMELLLTTPVRPLEVIVGKLAPYAALGACSAVMTYSISRAFFGLPFVGSHLAYAFGFLLFLICYLAQGLVISIITRKQTVAMQLSMMTALLPSQLLSGFVFPIESMPKAMQILTMAMPARWFMQISRTLFLRQTSFGDLIGPYLALAIFATVMIVISLKKFKRDLEP